MESLRKLLEKILNVIKEAYYLAGEGAGDKIYFVSPVFILES